MDGAELMLAFQSYADAACRIQELQMRKKEDARMYLQANSHLYTAISHEIDDISRLGVIPAFTDFPGKSDARVTFSA